MKPIQLLLALPFLLARVALGAADLPNPASTNSAPPPAAQADAGSNATPKTASASAAPRRDIRFQFDGIPYSDVVNRFAQMAGKPLLSDTNIGGTLTYDDPNAYSYTEALDTLNLMLAMKGVMLLEDGNNLRLVPFKQLPSMPIRILRGSDSTGDARPGEIVTVVLQINNLDAKEVADATLPLLSTAGSVAPLSKGRGVIITDRLANIQRVRTLLATIGPDQSSDRQMKTYTLVHASGAIVSDLLNRTFGLATAPRRTTFNPNTKAMEVLPADPNDYITSVYDEASRTMVLFGPPDRIALAEELINKFEDKDGSGGDVRIYYPQSIKAEDLAGMIRQAIPGVAAPNESSSTSSTKARVIADPSQNRLIVAAPIPAQLDQIEQLITRVDRGVQGAGGTPSNLLVPLRSQTVELTRIFRPRSTDATNVAAILRQALTRKSNSGQLITTASVSSDSTSKSVVVTGSPSDIQTASDIVSELETGTSQPTPLRTRFIDVGSPEEAKRILPLVEQLYLNQTADGLAGSVSHAKILADPDSGRLIVTATQEHLERIESIVQQLRLDRPQTLARHLQVIPLKNTRTETALPNIQSLVNERMNDRRFATLPKPSLVPDAANNRLLVTATEEQVKEINEVVRVVDIAPQRAERELEVIPLQVKQASEVIPLVTQLTAQLAAPGEAAPALMPDPAGKQIIVLAAAKDHARIRELVKQFDASPATAAPRQFQGVVLYNRNAAELTPLVQQLYQEQIRGQPEPAGGPATLIPETKNNRVMVSGSEKEITRVEAIIRQLDPARGASATNETRVVRLKTANAAELAGLVDKTVNARSQQVQVLMDARSNSLVVTGDQAAVEAAALMIQQLDTPADTEPREMRVIELKSADAATVAPILSSLYGEMVKSQRGADYVPAAKIVPDPAANRLIVTGGRSEIDQITGLLQKLDSAPEQSSGARVFKLSTVDAGLTAMVVSNAMLRFDARGRAFPRVTVTADEKSNSLIVAGTRADLQEAESVIAKLDGDAGGKERTLRVFEVKGDPDALAALIQSVFAAENPGRNMTNVLSVTPEPGGKRLFVLASAALMPQVETVVNTLDEKSGLERRELHSIDLTNAAAVSLLPRIRQIYAEQNQGKTAKPASVYADASGARVLVQGTAEQAAAVRQIIETLGSQSRPARETKSFDLGSPADVQRLLPLVQQLYQDEWRDKKDVDPPDAQFVPDPRSGRLLVTGKPDHLKQIEVLLQQLGAGHARASSRETRILDLTTASAVELAATARTLYLEEAKGRLGSQIPDTLITPDAGGNRLIVVGEKEELDAVEETVRKLDKVSAQSASARVFRIKFADPDKVGEILTNSLIRYDAYGRPQKRATVSVDAKTRTIIVTGDPKEMQGVSVIIEQLDQSLGSQPERKMKVFTLRQGKVADLSSKVRQLYNDRITSQPELGVTDLLIIDETKSNQLILSGNEAQLKVVDQIIEELQTAQAGRTARETKMIEGGTPDEMDRLLPLVQQLYKDRMRGRDSSDAPDAQIIADPKNARFIVTGRPNHITEIESILNQLRGDKSEPGSRDTRVYDLATATASDLAATVRTLYQEEAKTRPGSAAADTLILPDSGANRIIVTGATNEIALVEEIIKKLDKVGAQSASTRVIKLKSADVEKVVEILGTALVRYDAYGRPQKRVSVVPDVKTRTIIATGDPKDLQSASVIIEQLDSTLGEEPGRALRVIPAKERGVSEFGAKVRKVYEDQAKNRSELGTTEPLILEDQTSNQLIVAGTEKQLEAIGEIAGLLLKEGGAEGRQARVFPLEHASAASLVRMLSQVYAKQIASTEPSERVVITGGANDHSLMVEAPAATLARVEELLKSLEQPGPDGPNVVQTVHLTKGRAETLAEAVNRAITNKVGGPVAGRVGVTAVPGSNSLLINGPTNAVQEVMRIVHDLDQESANPGTLEIHVYKLENGVARQISAVIQQLLRSVTENLRRDDPPGESSRTPEAAVSVDERSNTLIVSGTAAHFKAVEGVLPTLDRAPERSDRDVQFVWLRKAKAPEVALQLDQLFRDRPRSERPVIEPDSQGNSLTIIAKRSDLVQIQDLVSRLDEQGKAASSLQVRVRPLDNVSADQMAKMLEHIYPQMSGTPVRVSDKVAPVADQKPGAAAPAPEVVVAVDKAANALILSGPAQELDNVDRLINDLSQNFSENESEFRIFTLKDADPVIVARTLTELLRQETPARPPGEPARAAASVKPRFNVVPESRTRSVIVRARPTDFALLESLIKQLDTVGQTAQLAFRVVPLTNAPPDKVLPLVQQMVAQLSATRPGESVTVGVDSRSRGLVVVARDTMADQVEKMIRGLDAPSANPEAEVRIVSLKKANAAQLAAVLESMLRPDAQGGATPGARELQEQVTRLKILNDDGQAVLLDLTKPIKISPDPAAGTGGGNRLLLMSTPDNLRALAAVVELMDSVPVLEGVEVRFVRLDHANATAVSQTLETIFTQGRQLAVGPGGPGAEPAGQGKALVHPLSVAVDARRNTIILSGREESVELAMRIIQNMDRDLEGLVTDVRLIRLKFASASHLLPLLQSVFAEGPSVPGTEGLSTHVSRLRTLKEGDRAKTNQTLKVRAALTIQADEQSNILIVAARADDLPLIQDVIDQLDIPSAAGLENVRLYPLEHADPAAVQKILTDLYSGSRAVAMRAEEKPNFSVDARTGTLIVAGTPQVFGLIEVLLARLDQKLPFELRDIVLIPLEHSDAGVTAATLQKVMDARVTQRATLNQGQADALKIIVIAEQRSNSLLVGGSREGLELVQTLAKQLDQANPALSGQVRLIPLQYADARVIAATLGALFEQRYAAVRATDAQRNKPILLADTRSNSLLVAASQEDNHALDDLLQKLDRKQDNPALTLTVLALKHNDSAKIATTIESIFAARLRAESAPGQAALPSEQIKLEPDPLNNAIVVSASKENLELIQGLVQKLDQEPVVADGVFETFTLQFADAQRVASLLKSLVDQGLYRPGRPSGATAKSGSARDILSISVDPPSNTLIVSASPENLAVVRDVVRRIDSKDLAATADVRLYVLKHARATTLAATLQEFFQAKRTADSAGVTGSQRLVPAAAIADDRMNSILVTGGKEAFDLVDRLLPQLDGEDQFARLNFRVFPLKRATALKLQATLQPIFANRPPRVKGEPVQPVTVIADQWVNALLVGASVEDLGAVASLVERLDAEPSQTGLAIHVFPLAKADARSVATTVQGLFRENQPTQAVPLTVAADERINAIVVSCGETDAQHIAELVKKLDTEQVSKISEIKVFPLQYARADALALILNTALNTKPPTLNQQQSPNAQSLLQFATLGTDGRQLITAALKEAVLVTSDPRMNSLIVSGPVDYMGLIGQIIKRLDSSSPQQAKIKVFTLHNANARQMGQLLTQLFRMSPGAASPGGNSGAIAGTERSVQYTLVRSLDQDDQSSPEVSVASATVGTAEQNALTVTIDPRTNSLLVGGSDRYVNLVSEIIDSLDSSAARERNSEVIRLKNSQATDVATAIRGFLDQERQKAVAALGADAAAASQRTLDQEEVAITAEPTSNTLLLSANQRYFAQIRSMINELDKAQPQVLIQVFLAEVTLNDQTDLGVEWSVTGNKGGETYSMGSSLGVANQLQSLGGFSAAASGTDLNFLIRALKTVGKLTVLSRPQIVTADNIPATINIGQRVPLVDQSRLDVNNNLTTSYTYQDIGVSLTVTPKISPDGFVKMNIGITNSDISATSVQINTSSAVPIIDQRFANTTVTARSGQTIIIGGLISTSDSKNIKKLPYLGDVPYLGALFRTSSIIRTRSELLVLLTPQVLNNAQIPVPLQDPEKVTREQLEKSILRRETERDELQKRLLDPLFPVIKPPAGVIPNSTTNLPQ